MTRIGLEGMEFYAFHGYYKAERKIGNKFIIDLFVELESDLTNSEDIDDTINYEHIFKICKEEMAITSKLLESVAFRIIDRLKREHPIVKSIDFKLKKPGVQLGGKVEQSVIEYKG